MSDLDACRLKPTIAGALGLLLLGSTVATAGFVSGTIKNAAGGELLTLFQGKTRIGTIAVGPGGKYNIFLKQGTYTVTCPNGSTQTIDALTGPVVFNIEC